MVTLFKTGHFLSPEITAAIDDLKGQYLGLSEARTDGQI